jgi:hypothetical protein
VKYVLALILFVLLVGQVDASHRHHRQSHKTAALYHDCNTNNECHFINPALPHTDLTPGEVDPNVTQANIKTTICKAGYTDTVRPSNSYTNRIKLQLLPLYGHRTGNPLSFELDHLIPLELGGAPSDVKNLWPQPYEGTWGARKKDVLEKKLSRMVCAGAITLDKAQRDISTDWVVAYQQYIK